MWIPSHVGLVGHELVDERARQEALEGSIFDTTLTLSDFQRLARPAEHGKQNWILRILEGLPILFFQM
jgi:hypothetical protein